MLQLTSISIMTRRHPEIVNKTKNLKSSPKLIVSPSKYAPSEVIHICQLLFQSPKHAL